MPTVCWCSWVYFGVYRRTFVIVNENCSVYAYVDCYMRKLVVVLVGVRWFLWPKIGACTRTLVHVGGSWWLWLQAQSLEEDFISTFVTIILVVLFKKTLPQFFDETVYCSCNAGKFLLGFLAQLLKKVLTRVFEVGVAIAVDVGRCCIFCLIY